MLNFFDSVSCETIIAENEAYEQVLAMVRLRTIGYIEKGVHDPSVQMAYRISNYFKVALPVLFPDLNEKPDEQEGAHHET